MIDIRVKSAIAGSVWKLLKQPGEAVAAGEDILLLESMKMEIPVSSPRAGTLHAVLVAEGEAVAEGDALLVIRTA